MVQKSGQLPVVHSQPFEHVVPMVHDCPPEDAGHVVPPGQVEPVTVSPHEPGLHAALHRSKASGSPTWQQTGLPDVSQIYAGEQGLLHSLFATPPRSS
ncbi:MAG: hypothetical protein Q8Q39_02700 [bacterium]|nr:hypothetical protein [bacterium]